MPLSQWSYDLDEDDLERVTNPKRMFGGSQIDAWACLVHQASDNIVCLPKAFYEMARRDYQLGTNTWKLEPGARPTWADTLAGLEKSERCLIPIFEPPERNGHWYLVSWEIKTGRLFFYDSIPLRQVSCTEHEAAAIILSYKFGRLFLDPGATIPCIPLPTPVAWYPDR